MRRRLGSRRGGGASAPWVRRRWTALGAVAITAAAVTAVGAGPARAIAGGREVLSSKEAPWMATLAVRGPEPLLQRASCGGALVAPDRVLTAAHCVAGIPVDQLREVAEYHIGATVLSGDPGQVARIAAVSVHPRYRLIPSPTAPDDPEAGSAAFDLAVITLDRPIHGVRPLPVASRAPAPGTPAVLYGHGLIGPPNPSDPESVRGDVLRRGVYEVTGDSVCSAATPATVDTESVLCGQGPAVACFGDSGGPLVIRSDGRRMIAGVFSFGMETAGKPCGTPGPNAFADTATTYHWIRRRLGLPLPE
ncbi:trypsin-like serine protease [Microbispora sp. NPDC049125]|uniref:S1 family peptidase n=1 Tax=Microbispora sp. NPDC049125 TaxID=3154929 RepID=UPI003467C55F